MDFWSRLIGGSRSLTSKSFRATSPTERLTAFKRTCNSLQQIWRSSNTPIDQQSTTTHSRNCIERLNSVLSDESRGPAPHPCLQYASSSQIFVTVTKLALSSYDDNTLRCAAVFFNTLIDAEVDGVVDNRLFARALVDLVRRADKHSEDVEGRLVELLFGVANNIRLQPDILPAWFAPRNERLEGQESGGQRQSVSGKEFEGATRKDDFPLFYLLVEYVHHEGRAGDFARTGLLYLIETASRSKHLERWLIESDLATLMATGLGALYSQLGSLSFIPPEENPPHIIALSDHAGQDTAIAPYLGSPMRSFMSYLLFWQDTIDHCKSAEVNGNLLDHFQILFLEQLLYPSLLESSDVEGGSTAAVLTYLYRILESVVQDDLVHRILHFLLASDSGKGKVDMSVSRRKSLDVLAAFAEESAKPSPSLFNLRDLALLGLQSSSRQTILATLRLLTVVLQRHHPFTRSLIRTVPGQPAKQRTIGALNAELGNMVSMATSIVNDPTLDESYDNYLKDASWILEAHLCIAPAEASPDDPTADRPLELQQGDGLIRELLNCLRDFFTNSVVVNLALTEVLMSIASSHLLSLDGWILVDPAKYNYPDPSTPTTDENKNNLDKIRLAYEEPTWSSEDAPTLTSILQHLVQQTQEWRKILPDFDILVAARRDLLHQEDEPVNPNTNPRSSTSRLSTATIWDSDMNFARGRARSSLTRGLGSASASPRTSTSAFGSPHRGRDRSSSLARPLASRESSLARTEDLRKRLSAPFFPSAPANPVPKRDNLPTTTEEEPQEQEQEQGESEEQKHEDKEQSGEQGEPNDDESAIVDEPPPSASLGHVLTNVIILYEFLLELSATVQVRGSLYEEAGFPGIGVDGSF
ncbi:uncharacterized protein ASPGLDRAFT_58771 [Aspergillus glaucus CBS 516.65]|uniref:FHF complex subunit HOOK-interacting protein C-terminal domain-containing protein n=1 Tax=Aspergillus glaucus CBS 516.65 TaxID=1160497 RepID=A0A1L9VG79_ASPGL|nr:hypothetical protein ASPGLDRAFT_58771 [Aspergillus glaucus CBS 516.65]OJJ82958.1 hypothetical protein ASPGLDRAFT_58771 [Aspergillus glaucus CBS 516.65]